MISGTFVGISTGVSVKSWITGHGSVGWPINEASLFVWVKRDKERTF
jgi:hypothetical protein